MKLLSRGKKRTQPSFRHRTFLVEPLESRSMLAGNVLANVDATGTLNLTGDAKVNNIDISYDTAAGAYVLTGVNTTIQTPLGNVSSLTLTAAGLLGFTGAINASLGAGNDVVTVNGASGVDFDGSLTVNGEAGNDSISIGGINKVAGNITVTGGAGNDSVNITDVTATGNVLVTTGAGNDQIVIANLNAGGTSGMTIDAGADTDTVNVSGATAAAAGMNISAGVGHDRVTVGAVNAMGALNISAAGTVKKGDSDRIDV